MKRCSASTLNRVSTAIRLGLGVQCPGHLQVISSVFELVVHPGLHNTIPAATLRAGPIDLAARPGAAPGSGGRPIASRGPAMKGAAIGQGVNGELAGRPGHFRTLYLAPPPNVRAALEREKVLGPDARTERHPVLALLGHLH